MKLFKIELTKWCYFCCLMAITLAIVALIYLEYAEIILTLATIFLIWGWCLFVSIRFDGIDDTLYEIKKSLKERNKK